MSHPSSNVTGKWSKICGVGTFLTTHISRDISWHEMHPNLKIRWEVEEVPPDSSRRRTCWRTSTATFLLPADRPSAKIQKFKFNPTHSGGLLVLEEVVLRYLLVPNCTNNQSFLQSLYAFESPIVLLLLYLRVFDNLFIDGILDK